MHQERRQVYSHSLYLFVVLFPDGVNLSGPVVSDIPHILDLVVVILSYPLHLDRAILSDPVTLQKDQRK
jgi:hypothetical protein